MCSPVFCTAALAERNYSLRLERDFPAQTRNGVSGGTFQAEHEPMKTRNKITLVLSGLALGMAAPGPAGAQVAPPPPPPVQAPAPAPAPAVNAQVPVPAPPVVMPGVPDEYVWDGHEYVGIIGNQYYYLGPGNLWMVLDPARLERFRAWQAAHADWHHHMTVNKLYRRDAHGHEYPWHEPNHDMNH